MLKVDHVHALNKLKKKKKETPHAMGKISNNDYGSRLILQLRRMTLDVAGHLEIIVPR